MMNDELTRLFVLVVGYFAGGLISMPLNHIYDFGDFTSFLITLACIYMGGLTFQTNYLVHTIHDKVKK